MNEKGEPNEEAGWASRAEEIEGPKTRGGNSLKSSKENDWFTEGDWAPDTGFPSKNLSLSERIENSKP